LKLGGEERKGGRKRGNVSPVIWQINKLSPIPSGARNVARCFSTASMKMTSMSWIVRNISMKRPWTVEVPAPRDTETRSGPGKSPVRFVSVVFGN